MSDYLNPVAEVARLLKPVLEAEGIAMMDLLRSTHRGYPFVTLAYGGHRSDPRGFVGRVLILVHAANPGAPGGQAALAEACVTVREAVRAEPTLVYESTGPSTTAEGHVTAAVACGLPESV